MKIGRKLIIAGVIVGVLMVSIMGCETLRNAFCSPTAQEVADAADFVANADALVGFMNTLAPSAEVERGDRRPQDCQGGVRSNQVGHLRIAGSATGGQDRPPGQPRDGPKVRVPAVKGLGWRKEHADPRDFTHGDIPRVSHQVTATKELPEVDFFPWLPAHQRPGGARFLRRQQHRRRL